jgi:hypothetical protein
MSLCRQRGTKIVQLGMSWNEKQNGDAGMCDVGCTMTKVPNREKRVGNKGHCTKNSFQCLCGFSSMDASRDRQVTVLGSLPL